MCIRDSTNGASPNILIVNFKFLASCSSCDCIRFLNYQKIVNNLSNNFITHCWISMSFVTHIITRKYSSSNFLSLECLKISLFGLFVNNTSQHQKILNLKKDFDTNIIRSECYYDVSRNLDQLACLLIIAVIKTKFLRAMKHTTLIQLNISSSWLSD